MIMKNKDNIMLDILAAEVNRINYIIFQDIR